MDCSLKTWVKLGVLAILSLHASLAVHDVTMRKYIEANTHCHKQNAHSAICHVHAPYLSN